jgi:hypothetical protein
MKVWIRYAVTGGMVLALLGNGVDLALAQAQGQGGRGAGAGPQQPTWARPGSMPSGVLGGVPLTAADSAVKQVVERLDFDSYKRLIRGLADFGDREQGTPRNAQANDWIEAQLRSWGYQTERLNYEYQGQPRSQVFATKIGSTNPQEMVILGAHMDGRGGGEAVNDNASGTALVLEIARILASPDVRTDRSVRFALWNNEETGLDGARAYVDQRAALQGVENPPGSGRYPEPRWIAMIQHDKVLFDHGNPVQHQQAWNADVDIEYQLNSARWEESARLGIEMINANRLFATEYPAALSNAMSNTDSTPFMDLVPAVSVRENRRLYEIGWRQNPAPPRGSGAPGSDPNWHAPTDLWVTYNDADFRLGFNAMQTTLGATGRLVGLRIAPSAEN